MPTLTIDTESDPGSWAEALRFPNAIRIIETAGTPSPDVTDGGAPSLLVERAAAFSRLLSHSHKIKG